MEPHCEIVREATDMPRIAQHQAAFAEAVTNGDNTNIVVALIARHEFKSGLPMPGACHEHARSARAGSH